MEDISFQVLMAPVRRECVMSVFTFLSTQIRLGQNKIQIMQEVASPAARSFTP